MKYLFLSLLISSQVLAAVPSRLVKVLDGTSAICQTKADIVRQVNGAYRLSKQKVELEQATLTLSYQAQFFTCTEVDGEIGFKSIGFTETFNQMIYSTSRGLDFASITTEAAEMRFLRDGVYKVLATINMERASERITAEIALADLLSESEMQKLNDGEAINTSIDTFLFKKVIFSSADLTMKNPVSFGAYRTLMTIKLVNGVLKVTLR